jgi:hypothetical protein
MEFENITTEIEPPVVPEEPVAPVVPEEPVAPVVEEPAVVPEEPKSIILTEVEVTNSNIAFNVIVSFLTVAQKRGTFSINESAKIWECLKFFLTPEQLSGIKQ